MKMKIYWLAIYDGDDETDMKCVAGPFPTWDAAFDANNESVIVEQIIDVN